MLKGRSGFFGVFVLSVLFSNNCTTSHEGSDRTVDMAVDLDASYDLKLNDLNDAGSGVKDLGGVGDFCAKHNDCRRRYVCSLTKNRCEAWRGCGFLEPDEFPPGFEGAGCIFEDGENGQSIYSPPECESDADCVAPNFNCIRKICTDQIKCQDNTGCPDGLSCKYKTVCL